MAHVWDDRRKEYVEVIKIANIDELGLGGGGGIADSVEWDNVTNKPNSFRPSEHDHDGQYSPVGHTHDTRYYTKEEIDSPEFLADRVDNITVALEGRELKVRSIEGLEIGVVDINDWLAGTSGNIQTQIDGINDSLVALTSGMRYVGKQETYADLMAITNKENGDLAVVLADENRTGGRSMYVYTDKFGMWEFIGEFTFTDEFLALSDTPSSYSGADGKVVKVAGERLVFGDVKYGELADKPSSTITEIDDAVTKKHAHSNKENLDEISENTDGVLTYKGEEYIRKSDFVIPQKKHLSAFTEPHTRVSRNSFLQFQKVRRGSEIPYNPSTGIFELEMNKSYEITVNMLLAVDKYATFGLADESKSLYYPYAVMYGSASNTGNRGASGTLNIIITPNESTGTKFGILLMSESSEASVEMREKRCSLVVKEI